MTEEFRPTTERQRIIELQVAEMEPLTAYDEEFFIPEVHEGEDVLVARGLVDGDCYLRCDFSAFEDRLKTVTPERLEQFFSEAGKLEQQAPDLDEDTRRLLNICWRTTTKTAG